MPYSCCAYNCKNISNPNSSIKFHSFPLEDRPRLEAWVTVVNRKNFWPTKYTKLCSAHFRPTDYKLTSTGKTKSVLKPDAVPSIFDYTTHMVKKSSPGKERRGNSFTPKMVNTKANNGRYYKNKSSGQKGYYSEDDRFPGFDPSKITTGLKLYFPDPSRYNRLPGYAAAAEISTPEQKVYLNDPNRFNRSVDNTTEPKQCYSEPDRISRFLPNVDDKIKVELIPQPQLLYNDNYNCAGIKMENVEFDTEEFCYKPGQSGVIKPEEVPYEDGVQLNLTVSDSGMEPNSSLQTGSRVNNKENNYIEQSTVFKDDPEEHKLIIEEGFVREEEVCTLMQ